MDRKIAQAIAVSSLIVGNVAATVAYASKLAAKTSPVTLAQTENRQQSTTNASIEGSKQESKAVKQHREHNKSSQSLAQSQPVASQVEFLTGTWEGAYTCGQGLTALKLVIEAKSTTDIDAVFLFSAHPQNLNVPSGSFRMKGNLEVFNSQDIPDVLDLKATTWINRPSGYVTVDLRGDVSQSKRRITGNVATPGCSTFDVVKRER